MLTDEEITAFYNKMTEFCATQTFASFRWETANVGEKQTQIIGVISFNDRAGGDMEAMSFSVISDSSQLILTTPGGIDKTVDFNNDDSAFTAWQDFFDEQRALYTQAITQLKTYPASKIIPEAANDDTPTLLDFLDHSNNRPPERRAPLPKSQQLPRTQTPTKFSPRLRSRMATSLSPSKTCCRRRETPTVPEHLTATHSNSPAASRIRARATT